MGANIISITRKIFLLLCLVLPGLLFGVPPHTGEGTGSTGIYKYLENYGPDDYLLQPQNWAIIQDKRGLIYAANQGGLLEFDGLSWKGIDIDNMTAYSLTLDDTGTIYVGGRDEFGYLAPDSTGALKYRSLVSYLDNSRKNFGPVWKTLAAKEGIYFRTLKFLFRWDPASKKITTWGPETEYIYTFTCKGKLYLHRPKTGLMQMIKDSPVLLPGSEIFADDNIIALVPYDNQKLLLGTRANGFYLYDGSVFTPFVSGARAYLEEKRLYSAARLKNGDFALATRFGGLVIIDADGQLKNIFDKDSGLQDNSVWNSFEDIQGNLWLALNKGITKIEYASPFSIYDDKTADLTGIVATVTRHGQRQELYAGTTDGLFLQAPGGKFNPVPGMAGICWFLLSTGEDLLAATDGGIFQLSGKTSAKITDGPSYILSRSRQDTRRTWAGTRQGLVSLSLDNTTGRWTNEYRCDNITLDIRTIREDPQGNLWLGTLTQGVINARFPSFPAGKVTVSALATHYGPGQQGLPEGEVHVFFAAGHIIFATEKGLYRFDQEKQQFIPDPVFGTRFADGTQSVFRVVEDQEKNAWIHSKQANFLAIPQGDGTYFIKENIFRRILRAQANAIYPDLDGRCTWFATTKGLICYDAAMKTNSDFAFQTLIRSVLAAGTPIYGGSKPGEENNGGPAVPIIRYDERNLLLEFAAPFFEAESKTQFQCLLENYDRDWTAWNKDSHKEYTNLGPGIYRFRVRAKNVYGTIGKEDTFQFRILAPWYLTWWAYMIYAAAAAFMVFLVVKWRSHHLVREKQRLEQIIIERTQKIKQQSEELEELANIKSRFFANISHEFRTPLTLIMGPLEQILAGNPGKDMETKANIMLRSSQRLLNLINELLDLAKIESGKMPLRASPRDIVSFIKNITMCFESLADQKKVGLSFQGPGEPVIVYFDQEKLEKVISNLLANAFNYTPEGGKVGVSVRIGDDCTGIAAGCVEIAVRDTGSCIPWDELPHIFDRFYRGKGSHNQDRKGAGIGLALGKDMVEMHHGDISVNSTCGDSHLRGTEFILRLPLGKEHLKPEEIVAIIEEPQEKAKEEVTVETTDNEKLLRGGMGGGFLEKSPPNPVTPAGPPEAIGEKPIILVVEDNADVRSYIRGAFEPGFEVVEAVDGKQGIYRAKEVIPDLIICDIKMPGMDGFEVSRTLKSDILTGHIPIIILTARVEEESVLRGLKAGADDYITKPFSPALLTARVNNLVSLRRQMQLEYRNRAGLMPGEIVVSPLDDEFYRKLQEAVESHLSDPDFNVEALSRVLEMSQATVYRKIQALTGKTPTAFISSYRLKRAAQFLRVGAGRIGEVAGKVGFLDKSYFSKCFKEQFHCLPSEVRVSGEPGTVEKAHELHELPPIKATSNEKFYGGSRGAPRRGEPIKVFSKSAPPRQEIILVVEDSEEVRDYLRGSLEPGYRVVEAADGIEGVARAVEVVPDLIISDIMMPGMDGYELCRVLKQDTRTCHIPIVLLTAKASEESMIRGLEIGADDYVIKPFNINILLARMENLLRLRSDLQRGRDREMALLPVKLSEGELDREFMKELDAVIAKNMEDPGFNVEQLAEKLYMNRATLYRKVLAMTGEGPADYIRSQRLKRGARLLESNFGDVTAVALEVGFSSSSYFAKCFKEVFHRTPSDYQASMRK